MSTEPLDRLERLFQVARLLPAEEWEDFLGAACSDDASMKDEILALLQADDEAEADGFLTESLKDDFVRETGISMIGQEIGKFRVLRKLGEGGMGNVFLARRDAPFKQFVALKVIRRGMDTQDVLRRFQMERQILASLGHPNIARLLDGGMTSDGLPYFAMEYVEGLPITVYADKHNLEIDERLKLFTTVCAAVQYAHQNLVIHRDLKPSNIMVADNGVIKLLDFGIAKLLNPSLSPVTLPVTHTELRLMTPEYASPEQVRGDNLTTVSDVYSLGVILYELLTGHRPYHLTKRNSMEIMQVVCNHDPERPSSKITQVEQVPGRDGAVEEITPGTVSKSRSATLDRLRRRLEGDLDNIVMMALRKEPSRRYGSPAELQEDIERFMKGLPVKAHRDSGTYRVRKFVNRHRVETVAACSILLALVVGLAVALWQTKMAKVERDRAEIALDESREVSAFLIDLFEASDPYESMGRDISARELLTRGMSRINELETHPAVQAQLLGVIGRVRQNLGDYRDAEELLNKSLSMRRGLLGPDDAAISESLTDLADLHRVEGRYTISERLFEEALDQQQLVQGVDPLVRAETMEKFAILLDQKGNYQKAEPLLREAIAIKVRQLGEDNSDVLESQGRLGELLHHTGAYLKAEEVLRDVIARQRAIWGEEHPEIARNMERLSEVLRFKGGTEEAVRLAREVVAMKEKILGPDHPEVAMSLTNLAFMQVGINEWAAADSLLDIALEKQRKVFGSEHPMIAATIFQKGVVRMVRNDNVEARKYYQEALAMRRRLLSEGHPDMVLNLRYLGLLSMGDRDYVTARKYFLEALKMGREKMGDDHLYIASLLGDLGMISFFEDKKQESAEYYREGLALRRRLIGDEGQGVDDFMSSLAGVLEELGEEEEALALDREVLSIVEKRDGPRSLAAVSHRFPLARLLKKQGQYEQSETQLLEALDSLEHHPEKNEKTRRWQFARARVARELVELYEAWNRPEEADRYRAEASEYLPDGAISER